MFSKFFKKTQKPVEPAEVYSGLRNRVLNLDPKEVGLVQSSETPNVWGVLMETGYEEAVVTLVSLADGTTSLYFSNGGGMIGGGEHATVAQSTKSFVASAEKYYQQMTSTQSFPTPVIGRVKFYILTFSRHHAKVSVKLSLKSLCGCQPVVCSSLSDEPINRGTSDGLILVGSI